MEEEAREGMAHLQAHEPVQWGEGGHPVARATQMAQLGSACNPAEVGQLVFADVQRCQRLQRMQTLRAGGVASVSGGVAALVGVASPRKRPLRCA